MKTKLSKKRAISTVLTTVIILVSSVVLGAGVVLYGTSLFQAGSQIEAIAVYSPNLWVHTTDDNGLAWGAAGVRNTGDVVLSIDKITVRGHDIPFGNWYADTSVNSTTFQQQLNHTGWSGTNGELINDANNCALASTLAIDLTGGDTDSSSICANVATGPIGLVPGASAIVYFQVNNGTLTPLDSGLGTTLGIYAGKAGGPLNVVITPAN